MPKRTCPFLIPNTTIRMSGPMATPSPRLRVRTSIRAVQSLSSYSIECIGHRVLNQRTTVSGEISEAMNQTAVRTFDWWPGTLFAAPEAPSGLWPCLCRFDPKALAEWLRTHPATTREPCRDDWQSLQSALAPHSADPPRGRDYRYPLQSQRRCSSPMRRASYSNRQRYSLWRPQTPDRQEAQPAWFGWGRLQWTDFRYCLDR